MNKQVAEAMLAEAKKNGIAEIVYTGTSSGGLYSSSSARIPVFLTRYPIGKGVGSLEAFKECLKSINKKFKPENFLDTVEVKDGFIKVTLNHLQYVENIQDSQDDYMTGSFENGRYERTYQRAATAVNKYSFTGWRPHGGEPLHTIMIPLENIVAIVC
jgi:hypothetical protein